MPSSKSNKLSQSAVSQDNIGDNDAAVEESVAIRKEDLTKFNSCMHYYKRDLSPMHSWARQRMYGFGRTTMNLVL